MRRVYLFMVIVFSLLSFTSCMQRQIHEAIYSSPEGGLILWGKTQSEMESSNILTPAGRYASGDQWESWCYQVIKAGYLPSEIVCRPDGETDRKVAFNLREIKTHISSDPPEAEIYWGPSEDQLTRADHLTPWEENRVNIGANYRGWYFQAKKEGYTDSEIRFLPYATSDRNIHFILVPVDAQE